MTKLVESYQGVVTEVLGDGLLVFWNTPDDVPGHAAKACAAAMAQQQVLVPLNAELARLDMPSLSVRIGLHTGTVLSGTIGSETKMKFGCLGDPVNLASRLEGLCKVYGVSVLCSGETFDALPKDSSFLCRELDLVQVKGRRRPTRIYEVVGALNCLAFLEHGGAKSAAQTAMQASTRALRASDVLNFNPIRQRPSFFRSSSMDSTSSAMTTATPPTTPPPGESGSGPFEDTISVEAYEQVELYERALREYRQAHFPAAKDLLQAFLEQWPGDRAAELLLERAQRYINPENGEVMGLTAEELAAWTGVTVMKKE
mmetsp:Transcript_59501/g.164510  ORF Transcript_59501/g.164510 Transcript_59501/m.164510 type:complete len:314 (-) Transcript_59501:112-1053(-)